MSKFEESNFYKALQDFFINADKKTFLQFLAEFYNRTEGIINKDNIQDELIKELRDLYLEFNEKGIDNNIIREKVNYFLENNVKIKNITSQLEHKANKSEIGSPLIAQNVSEMTDKTKVYVNTMDGNWYSWNGTMWVIGGVYNSQGIGDKSVTDSMLKEDYLKRSTIGKNILNPNALEDGTIQDNGLNSGVSPVFKLTPPYECKQGERYIITVFNLKNTISNNNFRGCIYKTSNREGYPPFYADSYKSETLTTSNNNYTIQMIYDCKYDGFLRFNFRNDFETNSNGVMIERVSTNVENHSEYEHYKNISIDEVSINELVNMKDEIIGLLDNTINPCDYSGTSMSMLNRGIAIGDSFTEGACNINNSNQQFITEKYNYPKILSKLSGVEIINKGHSGITSKGWYEKYVNTDLSGYDFAIIYLGINDYFSNNKTLYKTEYGQIIDKLRNENKHIKIFCVTQTRHFRDFANFTHYVREIATEKDCYLIDLEKYSTFSTGHITGSHPNAFGYFTMANDIYSYISYIIDNNIDNFKNHQFTNSDYSY